MREYGVEFVDDCDLDDKDWLIVQAGPTVVLMVKKSRVTPDVIAEAWASFRQSEGETDARPLRLAG